MDVSHHDYLNPGGLHFEISGMPQKIISKTLKIKNSLFILRKLPNAFLTCNSLSRQY